MQLPSWVIGPPSNANLAPMQILRVVQEAPAEHPPLSLQLQEKAPPPSGTGLHVGPGEHVRVQSAQLPPETALPHALELSPSVHWPAEQQPSWQSDETEPSHAFVHASFAHV
jgi:hypothetical protein